MKDIHLLLPRAVNSLKRLRGGLVPTSTCSSGPSFLVLPCLLLILCVRTAPSAHAGGTVAVWGANYSGQRNVPSGLSSVVAVAGGLAHSLALRADGTVVAWGQYYNGGTTLVPMTVPVGLSNVVAVAGWGYHCLALRADGTVVAWGYNGDGQTDVPAGLSNVVEVAGGFDHSLALRADGTVVAWGDNRSGQTTVPEGLCNVVAVAAGGSHSLALRADGTVASWGQYDQMDVPAGLSNVVAVAAGDGYSLVLLADGTAAAWGANSYGQTDVPAGLSNVVAVAGGFHHSLALRADGSVAAWGNDSYGQAHVPSGLRDVVAVAAGGDHSLAFVGLPGGLAAPQVVGSHFLIGTMDRPFHYRIMALNGATSYGASGLPQGLAVDPSTGLITGQALQAGTYSVVLSATNALGAGQWTVTLVVNLPLPGIAVDGVAQAIFGNGFNYLLVTVNDPDWLAASGLPSGLVFDSSSRMISGTPLQMGDFPVSVLASNRYGIATGIVTIRVSPVVAWGDNRYGQMNVPAGLSNAVAVAAGIGYSLVLLADGTVAAWGANFYGQTDVPVGLSNVVAVAAGGNGTEGHSLALLADGTVAAWGNNFHAQTNVPAGLSNVVAVAAGGDSSSGHSLALRADGTVTAWGSWSYTSYIPMTVPSSLSNVVAVAAGGYHNLALRADGTVAAWGYKFIGQPTVPADLTNVVAVAAGWSHSLALRADGTVAAWGNNNYGQTTVPTDLSNVVAIAAGVYHSLALRTDGTVAAWGGYSTYAPLTVPFGLSNVVAVAGGDSHSLALIDAVANPPQIMTQSAHQLVHWGGNAFLFVLARGTPPLSYQWQVDGTNIGRATHAAYFLANVQPSQAGNYTVTVSNRYGVVTNQVADLQVLLSPLITGEPQSVTRIVVGGSVALSVAALGAPSLSYQWRKGGVALPGANGSSYSITNVQQSHAGSYSVVVTNNYGAVTSADAELIILDPPPEVTWARRVARTSLTDDELAMGLATDSSGNLYVTGWFDRTNDFGGTTLTSYGGQDAFVAKYNSSGNLQWVRQAGGTGTGWDCARGVGVDAAENVYVTGGFLGTATFGSLSLTSQNNEDCFLAKYNSVGTLQWVRQGSDSAHSAYGTGIAVDSVGNSLEVGYFEGQTVSFGGITATNPGYSSSSYAAFIVKHNSAGTVQWARGLGGGDTYSTTVGMDDAGNCYVGGSFMGTLQLGTTNLTSAGDKDGFLAKFNSAGVLQWARQVTGPGWDGGRLGVNAAGNSWFVGNFTGSASIGPTNLTSPSGYGLFVARHDTVGNLQWVRQADSAGFLGTEGGCAIDASGNCYIPGIYFATVNFGGTVITNRGGWDIFTAKYDSAGNFQWVQTGGGTGNDGAFRAAVDTAGNCYMAGWFQGTALIGTKTLTAQGYWDTFVARIAAPAPAWVQFSKGSLSVSNGSFQMRLDGTPGVSAVVDTSSNLTSWTPWQTNTLPAGGLPLAMPMGTNRQFFRARIP